MVRRAGGALLDNLSLHTQPGRTLSARLASSLRQSILLGDLRPGERLPSTRVLAKGLALARTTVVEAFDRLVAEGLIESTSGSGTFVSTGSTMAAARAPGTGPLAPTPPAPTTRHERLARLMVSASDRIAHRLPHTAQVFTTATPAFDAFPMAQWSSLMARGWQQRQADLLGYTDPLGLPALRQAISRHLRSNRGLRCDPEQVFITAGAQQAFQLIAPILLDPGDTVWFEDPGAIGARNCFQIHGAHVHPVPVDGEGMRVEDGLASAPRFRLAFTTPCHQQPLGATLSDARRRALLAAARQADALVLEDDWDGDLQLCGPPRPALGSMDGDSRVIYVGSFSKTMFPALRLGYLVAPPSLVPIFEVALRAYFPGVPTSTQATMAAFIDEGLFAAHIRRMRRLYADRQDILAEACRSHLSPWLRLETTQVGMHAVAWLRPGIDSEQLSTRAAGQGLTLAPLGRYCLRPRADHAVVLGFAGADHARLQDGVRTLAALLRVLAP